MRALALALLLIAVPVTGCFDGLDCGTMHSAEWREPGLLEAIDAAPGRGEVYTLEAGLAHGRPSWLPEGQLAFEGRLGDVPASQVALLEVTYHEGTDRQADRAVLAALPDGSADRAQVRLETWGNRTRSQLADLMAPLVTNATAADEDTRERWLDALVEQRHEGTVRIQPGEAGDRQRTVQWIHTVNVTSQITAERVLAEHVAPNGTLPELDLGPGAAGFTRGNWTMRFWPDGVTATFLDQDPPIELQVDAFDRVDLGRSGGLWPEANRTQAWVNATFGDAGLPEPTFEAWRYQAVVC